MFKLINQFFQKKYSFAALLIFLFTFRTLFGLASEFWFEDELQIYLIGLKSFTTETWPYYGPDLVYTNTQIPGALQGLLISLPLSILSIPESPTILLNILSFLSFSFLAGYISRRITNIPAWLIWLLILTTPWAMYYSTRVVNPSYAVLFAIPFFVCLIDLLPIYDKPLINDKLSFFILGITTTFTTQLHMSYILMVPVAGFVFLMRLRTEFKTQLLKFSIYALGLLLGSVTLIPTLFNNSIQGGEINSNIVFNIDNWGNLPIILMRFLSFASNEIPYVLGGGSSADRFAILKDQLWMSPFAFALYFAWFLQLALFLGSFFLKKAVAEWRFIKWFTVGIVVLTYLSFFFSIKSPSSHTFYILMPLAI